MRFYCILYDDENDATKKFLQTAIKALSVFFSLCFFFSFMLYEKKCIFFSFISCTTQFSHNIVLSLARAYGAYSTAKKSINQLNDGKEGEREAR